MRISILSTGTNNVPPIVNPLEGLGHDVTVTVYDSYPNQDRLPALVRSQSPDWTLYVGALPGHHSKPVPGVDILAAIGEVAPMVHLCFDGGEPHWWRILDDYYRNGRFALMVNIDGIRTGPIGDRGFTTLCPVDATAFRQVPWVERDIACGFSGGLHPMTNRAAIMNDLIARGLVDYRVRDQSDDGDYDDFRRYLGRCRVGINFAGTGGGIGGTMHVKHRAGGELPAAGCLVLETRGSPLREWFELGTDYIDYDGVEGAAAQISWAAAHPRDAERMAGTMHAKVCERHSPAVFWSQVIYRLGMGEELYQAPEAPHHPWGFDPILPVVEPGGLPRLVADRGPCNVVLYGSTYYVVPKHLGQLDIHNPAHRAHVEIRTFGDVGTAVAAAEHLVDVVSSNVAEQNRIIRPAVAREHTGVIPPRHRLKTGAMRRGAIG